MCMNHRGEELGEFNFEHDCDSTVADYTDAQIEELYAFAEKEEVELPVDSINK